MHTPEPMTGTILVIDRDDRLPKLRAIFEKAGFSVLTANTAADGLTMAKEQEPDLVISEVMLEKPDSGFVLAHQMKKDPELANVPLILLSSIFQQMGIIIDLNSPEARQWVKADAYIDRPVVPERLLAKVASVLHQSRYQA